MKLASALAMDAVTEVVNASQTVDLETPLWQLRVALRHSLRRYLLYLTILSIWSFQLFTINEGLLDCVTESIK